MLSLVDGQSVRSLAAESTFWDGLLPNNDKEDKGPR
jgi:hypothetical protein